MLPSCAARKAPGLAGAACTAAAAPAPAPAGAARAAPALPAMSEALGRRVLCGAERATVRYVGGLPGAAGRWAAPGTRHRAARGGREAAAAGGGGRGAVGSSASPQSP